MGCASVFGNAIISCAPIRSMNRDYNPEKIVSDDDDFEDNVYYFWRSEETGFNKLYLKHFHDFIE